MLSRLGSSYLILLLSLMTVITGCEKKRASRFVQGDGEYVYAINDFKETNYTLKTGAKLTRGVTTKADEVVVDKSSVIRSFDAVEFSIDTDFGTFDNATMSNFQFFGKPDSEYPIRVAFTEDNLVFFKIAPEASIPSDEMTYAEKVEGDNYRVPLFGLPLGKYTTEKVKDDRGKSTNRIATFSKKFLKDATHFSVKAANPSYFNTELKLDMFPAKFFDEKNEWFFEVTVVDRPPDNNDTHELGYQLASGKAKFYKTNKTLTVVSQNTPDELKDQDPEKQTTILEIPAKWMDFRLMTTGDQAFLKEEVFNDIAAGAKYWKDRQYVQLQFDKILSDVLSTDSIVANTLRVKRLEVGDDYFSFIVFDALSKVSLHFSFAKENRIVEGLNYPLEDWKKYGFFKAFKKTLSDSLFASEEAQIKTAYVQRMYPKDNVVTFHITENTPKDPIFLEAIETALKSWDGAFTEAAKGTPYENNPIHVVFDKEKPVQNGDARYHKVSFYGYEVASTLLGYGPSVADDRNGETYSSTNHIYLRNYREQILRNLVKYVRFKLGVYNDLDVQNVDIPNQVLITSGEVDHDFSTLFGGSSGSGSPLSLSAMPGSFSQAAGYDYIAVVDYAKAQKEAQAQLASQNQSIVDGSIKKEDGFKDFVRSRKRLESGMIDEKTFSQELAASAKGNKTAGTCDYMAGTAISFKEIEDVCMVNGNRFKTYVDELLAKNQSEGLDYRLDDEKAVFYDCAQKLMKPTLISTLVHEFGHNFGLTHNFAGSSDAANFRRDANGVPEVRTTSVMDYAHGDAHRGFSPGPYDIATIRYGYYHAVEVQDKKTGASQGIMSIETKPNDIASVDARLKKMAPNSIARPYRYCWDSDIATGEVPLETPNCRRWDQGSDPVAQVRSFIDGFNTFMLTSANRFDNYSVGTGLSISNSAMSTYLVPIKLLYDKYRYTLFEKAFANGMNDPYFDIFTAAQTEEKVLGKDVLSKIATLKDELIAISGDNAVSRDKMAVVNLEKKVQALPEVAQYKLASEFIKDFYRQLTFSNDLYCVAVSGDGSNYRTADIQPFASLRTTIYNANGTDAVRCEDTGILSYYQDLAASGQLPGIKSVDKVTSVGNPTADIVYSADIQKLPIRNAIRAGYSATRMKALSLFANRSTDANGISLIKANGFFPSILDEEDYRSQILSEIRNRYVNGVSGDQLLTFAGKKLGKTVTSGQFASLADKTTGRFYLPYFEEETEVVQSLLQTYRTGAISPLAVTNVKIMDIQVSTSPEVTFLNFIRTAPDAAEYRYFIAGSTAYYSKGIVARDILASMFDTSTSVAIAEQMALATDSNGALVKKSEDQVRRRVVQFAQDFATELSSGDVTAKNVLYKVRTCVKDKLVGKYQNKLGTFTLQADPDFAYIQSVCRKPALNGQDGNAVAIAKYFEEADKLLDFITTKDNQTISIALVESVLTQVGLPATQDKKKTWAQIMDATSTKTIKDLALPNSFEAAIFQGVVNDVMFAQQDGQSKLAALATDPTAFDGDIKRLVSDLGAKLAPYAKYRDLFKKKVDILQTAIYNSAR